MASFFVLMIFFFLIQKQFLLRGLTPSFAIFPSLIHGQECVRSYRDFFRVRGMRPSKIIFRKSICSLMAFVIGFTQISLNIAAAESIADQTQDLGTLGKEANWFGKELGSGAVTSAPSFDGTTIRFRAGNSDIEISKDSLAPTDNGKNIRYSYTAEDFENQKNLYNDDEKMTEVGGEQKDKLFADSESDSPHSGRRGLRHPRRHGQTR